MMSSNRESRMSQKLSTLGTYAGYLGLLLFVVAIAGRFYGGKTFMGFQAINIFIVGVGALVWACWAKLEAR